MRQFKLIQTALLFFLGSMALQAQYVPGVEWYKIQTDHFIVIFPGEIADEAGRVAVATEEIYRRESMDFDVPHEKRWPLILTTTGMVSNGYVTLAPRKSVWFGTPSGEGMSALGWYDVLGLHETRHMVQMDFLDRGFIRFLHIIGGELGLTAGIHLSVPSWYFEGDAVSAETSYSEGGRGRDPLFYDRMKILTLNENYSYQKFVNRSFKDYIPDQYVFGYFMTSYIKKTYGDDSWNQILKTASILPLPAFGIYLGAKKVTGKPWSRLFDDMMKDLKETWRAGDALVEIIPNTPVMSDDKSFFSSYETVYADGLSVIARKTSQAEPGELVRIIDGVETGLFRIPLDGDVTSDGNRAVWTFIRPSVHYESRSWSDLVVADLESGRKKVITKKERLLYPAFSPDGRSLVTVFWSKSRASEIWILDTDSWDVIRKVPLEVPGSAAYPAWSADGRHLYFTIQDERGRGVFSLDLVSEELSKILDFSFDTVKRVHPWKNYIIYSSGESGYENLMAVNLDSDEKYRITSRLNGIRNAWISDAESRVYYSETIDSRGEIIVYQDLRPQDWIKVPDRSGTMTESYSDNGSWTVHDLHRVWLDDTEIPDMEKFNIRDGLFRIHSWGITPNLETMTGLRFQFQSTDLMDTLNIAAGSEYEINEKTWGAFLDADWKQIYPVLRLRNSMVRRSIDGTDLWDGSFRAGFSFPMAFRRDVWYFYLNPALSTGLRAYFPIDGSDSQYYYPFNTGIAGYAVLPGSSRSINPDWGIVQRAGSSMDLETPESFYRFYSDTRFYFPGLFRNTSLSLNTAFEEQSGQYQLSFPFARGYESGTGFRTYKGSADYDFPLFYPDFAGGSFFYISRIRGKLFYDFTGQENRDSDFALYQSAGAELIFDMTAANQSQGPFSLGLRYVWLLDKHSPVIQLVFINVSL